MLCSGMVFVRVGLHRRCAGLSKMFFDKLSDPSRANDLFYYSQCRLASQQKDLDSLRSIVKALVNEIEEPKKRSEPSTQTASLSTPSQNENNSIDSPPVSKPNCAHNRHMPTSASPRSASSLPPKPPLQRTRADRKFNLIIYGVKEQPKGTLRHIRAAQDEETIISILSSVHSSITKYSVRDCFCLGK